MCRHTGSDGELWYKPLNGDSKENYLKNIKFKHICSSKCNHKRQKISEEQEMITPTKNETRNVNLKFNTNLSDFGDDLDIFNERPKFLVTDLVEDVLLP